MQEANSCHSALGRAVEVVQRGMRQEVEELLREARRQSLDKPLLIRTLARTDCTDWSQMYSYSRPSHPPLRPVTPVKIVKDL